MNILKFATLAFMLFCGTALAQSPTAPVPNGPPGFPNTSNGASMTGGRAVAQSPATAPTAAQCTAGYQSGMSWTREEFMRACAQMNGTAK